MFPILTHNPPHKVMLIPDKILNKPIILLDVFLYITKPFDNGCLRKTLLIYLREGDFPKGLRMPSCLIRVVIIFFLLSFSSACGKPSKNPISPVTQPHSSWNEQDFLKGKNLNQQNLAGIFIPSQTWRVMSGNSGRIQELPVIEGQYLLKGTLLLKIEDEKFPLVLERQRSALKEMEGNVERDTRLLEGHDESTATPSPLGPEESPTPFTGDIMNEMVEEEESGNAPQDQAESPGLSLLAKVNRIERKQTRILRAKVARDTEFLDNQLKLEEAQVNRIKAEIALTEKQISETVINSILDGVVSKLSVTEGAPVKPNDLLAEVQQVDPIELKLNFPVEKLGQIEKGMKAKVSLEDLPGQELSGEISYLGAELNPEGQLEVRIRVPNPNLKIKAGMKGSAEIIPKAPAN